MNTGRTIFSQLLDHFPHYQFSKLVKKYNGEYKVKSFTCYNQWLAMAFAQLTYRESLRDIEICLRVFQKKLYHVGIRGTISRNTLANANNNRDWRIYADFAMILIRAARSLYAKDDLKLDIKEMIYAFDSTTIDLCLALFPWAKFRKRKAAIKLHTLLDLRGSIPAFIWITEGKIHDVKALDILVYEANAYYIFDRGYLDFGRLYKITTAFAFFVTRLKSNSQYRRVHSNPSDHANGIISDQIILLTETAAAKNYPDKLRRIHFLDIEHGIHYAFLTNNFEIPALAIAKIYKARCHDPQDRDRLHLASGEQIELHGLLRALRPVPRREAARLAGRGARQAHRQLERAEAVPALRQLPQPPFARISSPSSPCRRRCGPRTIQARKGGAL